MRLALHKLTKPELREITENANFTEDEMMVFQLSSKGCSIIYIADTMKISSSTVKRILQKICGKMERIEDMSKKEVPIWQKVTMTIDEASAYSSIGAARIRELANNPRCTFSLTVGTKKLIKRKEFDKFIENNVEL